MTAYRRDKMMGASYFFTVNLLNRQSNLLTRHIDDLRSSYQQMIAKHPMHVDAMVILHDHIHAIWTLPEHDDNYSIRWQAFKVLFSKSIPKDQQSHRSESRIKKRELGVWQRRFWEHRIRDENRFSASYGLHSLQSSQAWVCDKRERLGIFHVSSVCKIRNICE